MTGSRGTGRGGGGEMMEVVWEQRGESQGSLWELVAFEPDLRGRMEKSPSSESGCGYSGRGNGASEVSRDPCSRDA